MDATVFLIIALIVSVIPFVVLWVMADRWNQSMLHVLWGFLGWIGVIIGLLIMNGNRRA